MTGAKGHNPEPDSDWIAPRHRDLLNGLSRHLDQDAGLRDIMLYADHADLTRALGRHLDAHAGIQAILSSPAAAPRNTAGQTSIAVAIAAADPAVRLALRRDPLTRAVILSNITLQALTIAYQTDDRSPDLDRTLDLARAIADAIELARDHVSHSGLRHALGVATTLIPTLQRDGNLDLSLAHDLAFDLAEELARFVASALDLPSNYAVARDLDLDVARSRSRDLDLTRSLARGVASSLVHDLALARNLDHARALARRTAEMVGAGLGLSQVDGLAGALLEGALDDFTHADLARTDLTGRDLTGIRWADPGTTWPPAIDTGALRARSREVASGIYVITSPGKGNKARHYTPA